MRDGRDIAKGLMTGAVTGIAVGLAGFSLLTIPKASGMGDVMFLLVPTCAGFAIALVTRHPNTAWAALLLSVLPSLVLLVSFKKEGVLCALVAFPLLLAGLAIGAILGYAFRRYVLHGIHENLATIAFLALTPVLILAGRHAERPGLDHVRRESVSNSVRIPAPPEEVWGEIQLLPNINATKPWLMHVGLPVPVRCSLVGKGIGAKRTCYFENGTIEETVTEWSPPYSMRLSVDRTNMPGRHWLGFESAGYELRKDGDDTVLTRTTIITSHLYPVWYWRYFERLGVASEHRYILQAIAARIPR